MSEESDHSLKRKAVDPNGCQAQSFRLGSSSVHGWSTDFRGCCELRALQTGYWLLDIGLGIPLGIQDWLWLNGDAAMCVNMGGGGGGGSTQKMDLRHWGHCVFSRESCFMSFHSDGRARVRHRQKQRLVDACIQPTDGKWPWPFSHGMWCHQPWGWWGELVM